MYLDHTFRLRLSLSEITSLFGLSRYLEQTFAQQIGSAKVKSKSEVSQYIANKPVGGVARNAQCSMQPLQRSADVCRAQAVLQTANGRTQADTATDTA